MSASTMSTTSTTAPAPSPTGTMLKTLPLDHLIPLDDYLPIGPVPGNKKRKAPWIDRLQQSPAKRAKFSNDDPIQYRDMEHRGWEKMKMVMTRDQDRAEITRLQALLHEKEDALAVACAEKTAVAGERDAAISANTTLHDQLVADRNTAEQAYQRNMEEITSLHAANSSLSAELAAANGAAEQQKQRADAAAEENERLHKELAEVKNIADHHNERANAAEAETKQVSQEYLGFRLVELNNDTQLRAALAQAQQHAAEQQQLAEKLAEENSRCVKEYDSLADQCEGVSRDLEEWRDECAKLSDQGAALTDENIKLLEQMVEMNTERERVLEQLAAAQYPSPHSNQSVSASGMSTGVGGGAADYIPLSGNAAEEEMFTDKMSANAYGSISEDQEKVFEALQKLTPTDRGTNAMWGLSDAEPSQQQQQQQVTRPSSRPSVSEFLKGLAPLNPNK